ncbi:MAG: RND family efflux transporter MFP subunit [Oceanicoccus sp.]|jgi:RND family efflux transporter MFP subunit
MKYSVKIGVPILILIGSIAVAWTMISSRPKATQVSVEQPTLLVNSFVVQPQDIKIEVSVSGTVEPHTETLLVSEVPGRIVEVSEHFLNGGFFRKGEVVLRIDPRNHQAELKRAEASLVRARTQLAQETSLSKYERGDFEKLKALNLNIAESSSLSFRKAQLTKAEAEVVAAEAQVIRATGDFERTEIRMPYDGLIRNKQANLGQYVSPGTPLLLVFAVDYVEVRLPLSPPQVKKIDLPMHYSTLNSSDSNRIPVLVSVVDNEQTWPAELVRTEAVLDPNTRTLFAVARVQDPYGLISKDDTEPLRIGTFVDVAIPGTMLKQVYRVERHMLKPGNVIWIIDKEQRIRSRIVGVSYADSEYAYIDSGLNPGDRICITPIENPLPGTPVRIVKKGENNDS